MSDLKYSKLDDYMKIRQDFKHGNLYDVRKATKGKALIISVSKFDSDDLHPLLGHDVDHVKLCRLWRDIGFKVITPGRDTGRMDASEIFEAVKKFCNDLTENDQMAVICVNSQGTGNLIFGSDGGTFDSDIICKMLDAKKCPAMNGKPKLVMINCNGGNQFIEFENNAVMNNDSPAEEDYLATGYEDLLICFPTTKGQTSWVYPKTGSVYVSAFVDVFSQHCWNTDLSSLMLKVNEQVSLQDIRIGPDQFAKQLPRMEVSLRKRCYLLPTSDARDWTYYDANDDLGEECVTLSVVNTYINAPMDEETFTKLKKRVPSIITCDTFEEVDDKIRKEIVVNVKTHNQNTPSPAEDVYNTTGARKGKACIISISKCEVDWLGELPGYDVDALKLSQLWKQIGLTVVEPKIESHRCLTANELQETVGAFRDSLSNADNSKDIQGYVADGDDEDQVAVLCILSHGTEGAVYGSDGNLVSVADIMDMFSDAKCDRMVGKPKILIIQACQGGKQHLSRTVEDSDNAPPALAAGMGSGKSDNKLPFVSDMLVCYPSMQGYQSYVFKKSGSVYVKAFVEVLAEKSGTESVQNLLPSINRKVKEAVTKIDPENSAAQMSRSEQNFTKILYL